MRVQEVHARQALGILEEITTRLSCLDGLPAARTPRVAVLVGAMRDTAVTLRQVFERQIKGSRKVELRDRERDNGA